MNKYFLMVLGCWFGATIGIIIGGVYILFAFVLIGISLALLGMGGAEYQDKKRST